nr:Rpn family recombination-promoting nuclease/putative transposase [Moraxellaceae bacterium]
HDKFFKTVFSKKEAVAEFIEKLLPKDISQHIDLESLELDSTEYTDEQLKTHCSDVVYNCDYISTEKNKLIPIKISLLFEHKSYPEKYPHFQLMRYFLNMWEVQIKQKQDLTFIIPIIFFHGKSKWNKKPFTEYFTDLDANLLQFLPNFDYLLLDTNQYNNEDFQELNVAELQYSILTMKYIFNMEKLLENLAIIFTNIDQFLESENGRKFFQTLAIYLFQHSDLDAKQWREKMRTVSPQAEKQFVSTYDQAINTGMARGMQKGMELGMQKVALSMLNEGSNDEFIIKVTGFNMEQLSTIKKSVNRK